MNTRKKRILLCNDAHFLYTGYAKYGKEFLTRLTNTGKYDIAELACYGKLGDCRDMYANWAYYANHVDEKHPLHKVYESHPHNEFGRWRFERVCLDFKPDIVVDIRDPWMSTFEHTSPYREFYHWAIMPTVDSAPQKDEWLEIFADADSVFTYSDWGLEVLNKESNNTIKTVSAAPPGCDISVFNPVQNKEAHRAEMGFFADANIIGTIMRNQGRKLYPDLFEAFRKFIDLCYARGRKDLADKSYLYVHCSYPDVGWEIPELLREHGLGRKVIFTYICRNCNNPFCALFRDARTVCPKCNSASAILPNTVVGLNSEQLAQVINLFDVYIQYSICEGFGMPQVEAAACGVPVMAVDYSAMSDIVQKTEGILLPVQRMFRDIGTTAYRALPDNEQCAEIIYSFFSKPSSLRRIMGHKARLAVEKYYTWDRTIKLWEDHIDNIVLTGNQGKWNIPKRHINKVPETWPENISNPDFIDWEIVNVLQDPKRLNTRFSMRYLRQLNYGGRPSDKEIVPVNRKSIHTLFMNQAENKRMCELARCGDLELEPADYIDYARKRLEYL